MGSTRAHWYDGTGQRTPSSPGATNNRTASTLRGSERAKGWPTREIARLRLARGSLPAWVSSETRRASYGPYAGRRERIAAAEDVRAGDAGTLGYRVVMVADANAARRDEDHNATLYTIYRSLGDVRPTADVIELVQAARRQHAIGSTALDCLRQTYGSSKTRWAMLLEWEARQALIGHLSGVDVLGVECGGVVEF